MKKIFAKDYYKMLTYAAKKLADNAEKVNALNVFPVPDGDTGSNMSMTISGVNSITSANMEDLGTVAKAAGDLMLRSARGNSGVILSVYFRGLASGLAGLESAGAKELVPALASATTAAYGAVMNPTEGTILSVMRAASEAVADFDSDDTDLLFKTAIEASEAALEHTPEQLPVLKEAGVVDAGGCGFMIILTAMNEILSGNAENYEIPEPAEAVSLTAAAACDTEIVFPYCTECIVEKAEEFSDPNAGDELHEFLLSVIGDSLVYVEDESIIKLHIHTSHPGSVLSKAEKYGEFLTVKIENMRKQHTELASIPEAPSLADGVGFVAVSNGDGICEVFRDLGVNEIVSGGQTMNPSTDDLLDAIKKVGLKTVFVLPNNSNIVLTANTTVALAEELGINVRVIPSKSIPQGITALYDFDPEADIDTNEKAMVESLATVKSLSVTNAIRDAVIGDLTIKEGQFIGLVENKVKKAADSFYGCVDMLLDELTDCSCIIAYCGEALRKEDAAKIKDMIESKSGDSTDVTVLFGGQPVYSLIISGE